GPYCILLQWPVPVRGFATANRNPSPLDCFFHETRNAAGVTIFPDPRKRPETVMALACAGSRAPRAEGRGSMATITRNVVVLSAVVAAALVVAFETGGPRAETPPATAQVAQRFPLASEIFTPVPITYYVAQ